MSIRKQEKRAKCVTRQSPDLDIRKPLQNQAFFAPEMKGEYDWSTRCGIGGMKEETHANNEEGGMYYRQRYDDKAAGQAAAETDRVPRQGADPLRRADADPLPPLR